jgi:hypothetical protein
MGLGNTLRRDLAESSRDGVSSCREGLSDSQPDSRTRVTGAFNLPVVTSHPHMPLLTRFLNAGSRLSGISRVRAATITDSRHDLALRTRESGNGGWAQLFQGRKEDIRRPDEGA